MPNQGPRVVGDEEDPELVGANSPGKQDPGPSSQRRPTAPVRTYTAPSTSPQYNQLVTVERESYGKLPTDLAQYLSDATDNDDDLKRLVKMLARQTDLPWAAYARTWGLQKGQSWADLPDPYRKGQNLTAASLSRLTNNYEPAILASMLPSMLGSKGDPSVGQHRDQTDTHVDPAAVSRYLKVILPAFPNRDLDAGEATAMAITLARRKVKLPAFRQNLTAMTELAQGKWDQTPFIDEKTQKADWKSVVWYAMDAAKSGKKFAGPLDAGKYLLGKVAPDLLADYEKSAEYVTYDPEHDVIPESKVPAGVFESWVYGEGQELTIPGVQWETMSGFTADDTTDFNLVLEGMAEEVQTQETMFQNSPMGKALNLLAVPFNAGQRMVEQAVTYAAAPVAASATVALEAALPGDQVEGAGWHAAYESRDRIEEQLGQGMHWGGIAMEAAGAPTWTYAPADLAVGLLVDPFIIVGKGLTSLRSLRAAPELLEKAISVKGILRDKTFLGDTPIVSALLGKRADESLFYWSAREGKVVRGTRAQAYVDRIVGFATGHVRWRGISGHDLGKAALKGDAALSDEMGKLALRFSGAQTPLDNPLISSAAQELRRRFSSWTPVAQKEWEQVILAHYGFRPPPDSVAAVAFGIREAKTNESLNSFVAVAEDFKGRSYAATDSGLLIPKANARELVEDVAERMTGQNIVPLRQEVPYTRLPFGVKRIGNALATNERFGESGFGRKAIAGFNVNPGNRFKMFEQPEIQTRLRARRWAEFKPSEVADYEARIARASRSVEPENEIREILAEMDERALQRAALSNGRFPQLLLPDLIKDMKKIQSDVDEQVFGALPQGSKGFAREPARITRPLTEPQLSNEMFMLDPIDIKHAMNQYTGVLRSLRDSMLRHMDPNFPTLKTVTKLEDLNPSRLYEFFDKSRALYRAFVRLWKFTVVPRPGYVGRVILLDENLRFAATTGGLIERFAATNLEDSAAALGRAYLNPLPGVPVLGRGTGAVAGGVGKAAGKAADKTVGGILDRLWPDRSLVYADGTELSVVNPERPGRWLDEPLANTQWRESELTDEFLRQQAGHHDVLKAVMGNWNVVKPGSPGYYESWNHALVNQLALSRPGQVALREVVAGHGIEETSDALMAFARQNVDLMKRIGINAHETRDWAMDLSKVTHSYTLGMPELAGAALARPDDLVPYLRGISKNVELPPVHGPLIAKAAGLDHNWLRGYVEYWYDTYVRGPENVLNRQPYYRVWKVRAENAILGQLQRAKPELVTEVKYADVLKGTAVSEKGVPIRVYHGTNRTFNEFDAELAREDGLFGPGFYHTEDPAIASTYSKPYEIGAIDEPPQVRFSYLNIKNPVNMDNLADDAWVDQFIESAKRANRRGVSVHDIDEGERYLAELPKMSDDEWDAIHDAIVSRLSETATRGDVFDALRHRITGDLDYESGGVLAQAALRDMGHDGIVHTGGRVTGGATHRVWIAFSPEQVLPGVPESVKTATLAMAATPEVKNAINLASREFALGQVKRVMFDFTENTRIAEMLSGVFPFIQPYQEAFLAWGHILTQKNPAAIGYFNQMYRYGLNSGFLKRDPETGELMIPTSWWMAQSLWMRWLSGQDLFGESADLGPLHMLTSASSVNLFLNSTIRLPGGFEVPVPSLGQPWSLLARPLASKIAPDGAIAQYLNSFGPRTPIAPPWLEKFIAGAFPSIGNEDTLASMEKAVHRTLEHEGVLDQYKAEGKDSAEIADIVHNTARNTMIARGLATAFQIGSTQVEYSFTTDQQALINAIKEDPIHGMENWLDANPGKESLAVGTMAFAATLTDPQTGLPILDPNTGNPITGIRLPYSDFTVKFLHSPRTKELISEGYGPMIAALVLDQDKDIAQKFSPNAFSQLVFEGWFKPKPYEDFAVETESPQFWNAVETFYSGPGARVYKPQAGGGRAEFDYAYTAKEEKAANKYGEDSLKVQELKNEEVKFLISLRAFHPTIADRMIEYTTDPNGEIVDAQWRVNRQITGMPQPAIEWRLRNFIAEPGLQNFPSVIGANAYFKGEGKVTGRDELYEQMGAMGISDINSDAAHREGFFRRFEKLKSYIEDSYPTGWQLVSTFIDDDLGAVPNAADEKLKNLEGVNPDRYALYAEMDSKWRKLQKQIGPASGDHKFDLLAQQRDVVDDLYQKDPKLVDLWYRAKGYSDRVDHTKGLATRDPFFYSRYDWHEAGLDLSNKAVQQLKKIQTWQDQIFAEDKQALLAGKEYGVGDQFTAMNRWIRQNWMNEDAKKDYDKSFVQAIHAINEWGWPIEAAGYTKGGGMTGDNWRRVLKLARGFQAAAESNEWLGITYGAVEDKAIYAQSKRWIEQRVNDMRQANPTFDRQWKELDEQLFTGDLIDFIIPDDWFGGIGRVI